MNKVEGKKLQTYLCSFLKEYLEPKGFIFDAREHHFVRNNIVLPFFLTRERSSYVSIYVSIYHLDHEILNVLKQSGFLNSRNATFTAGPSLISFFGKDSVFPHQDKVDLRAFEFSFKMVNRRDVDWILGWYVAFMMKIGWDIINHLENEKSTYDFYRNIVFSYIKNRQLNNIDIIRMGILPTLAYLGLKYEMEEIDKIIDLSQVHFESNDSRMMIKLRSNNVV